MATKLIPEELDALIQEYLTDGILTDKERAVILKKAESMGLDRDEIDLYLDAQVQKIDQAADAVVRRQKSKACPYCGAPVPLLTDKCPECGQFITPEANTELQEIFDNLEDALIDMKAGKDISRNKATVERYARKAKMYYGSNPKVQKLLEEVENEIIATEKRIVERRKKETIARTLKNPWTWLVIVIVVFGSLFFLSLSMRDSAVREHREIIAKMVNFPEYERYKTKYLEYAIPDKDTSPEFAQLLRDYQKEEKTREDSKTLGLFSFFGGIILIIITIVLGVRRTNNKKVTR